VRATLIGVQSLLGILGGFLLWPPLVNGQVDVGSIIRQSAEANERDWVAVPEFDNSERDRNREGDKTYAVTILYGSPYERLIAVNGRSLGLRDIARQAAREAERIALQDALNRCNGNRAAAARQLKVSYKTLLQKLAETGLSDAPRLRRLATD